MYSINVNYVNCVPRCLVEKISCQSNMWYFVRKINDSVGDLMAYGLVLIHHSRHLYSSLTLSLSA